jgi:peptidoglycan/xylan/chitin deacetylase (PgdA/CDA1 family)
MKTTTFITNIVHRPVAIPYKDWSWRVLRAKTRFMQAYADWRVSATYAEKHAYKTSDSILLTFDDYGTPAQITDLLKLLASENVRAMFFLQGDWAQANPDLVDRIAAAGHAIGNHTYSHPDLRRLTDDEVRTEITSGLSCSWLRPPQGRYNARIRAIAKELGYRICYWSIDSDDWQGSSAEYMERKILQELHPGAVILFHAHAAHTIEALPSIIRGIRSRGFKLASTGEVFWENLS